MLSDRKREVEEVLDSLADGRNYVALCGAFPLVEYVLSKAAGKWNQPDRHQLEARLDEPGALSPDDEAALLIDFAAVEMVLSEIPELWKPGRHKVGAVTASLNRHLALHGTGVAGTTRRTQPVRSFCSLPRPALLTLCSDRRRADLAASESFVPQQESDLRSLVTEARRR